MNEAKESTNERGAYFNEPLFETQQPIKMNEAKASTNERGAYFHEPLFEAVVMDSGHVPFTQAGLDEQPRISSVRVVTNPTVPLDGDALCQPAKREK